MREDGFEMLSGWLGEWLSERVKLSGRKVQAGMIIYILYVGNSETYLFCA